MIEDSLQELRALLVEGVITEQYVIDNVNPLLDCMRKCNVALRWRLLHRRTSSKKFADIIVVRTVDSRETSTQ
jgi:WASH complex subunit strumpellin